MDYHNCSFMEEVSSSLCKGGEASGNQRVEKMKGSIYREGGVPWCLQGLWASLAFKILRLLNLGRVCLSQRTSGDFHIGLFCFLQVSRVLFTDKHHENLLTVTKGSNTKDRDE